MRSLTLPRLPKWAFVLLYLAAMLLAGFYFFMQVRTTYADIAFGAITVNEGAQCDTTCTFAHTVGAGTDRILVVAEGHKPNGTEVTAVTYNGVSLTKVTGSQINGSDGKSSASIWFVMISDQSPSLSAAPSSFSTSIVVW